MTAAVLYPLLTAALYYLGSRALVTRPLWSRYGPWLGSFMACAACSGFWYGAAVAALGGYLLKLPFLDLPGDEPATIGLVAAASLVWTPVVAFAHITRLEALGAPAAPDGEDDGERNE